MFDWVRIGSRGPYSTPGPLQQQPVNQRVTTDTTPRKYGVDVTPRVSVRLGESQDINFISSASPVFLVHESCATNALNYLISKY